MSVRIDITKLASQGTLSKEVLAIMLCHFSKRMLASQLSSMPFIHYHFRVVTHRQAFKMKNQVILISPQGKALCLLKTQFAKKPKNPV
ncbi:MAG: hypothetical protein V4450_00755 [Bacteroidota bacterium]